MKTCVSLLALISTLALMAAPAGASEHMLIGNHGEGILEGGKLILRDFEQNGIGQPRSPVMTAPHPTLTGAFRKLEGLQSLGLDPMPVALRLSDAESLRRGFGTALLETIAAYHWQFTDNEMMVSSDTGGTTVPRGTRVAIANRLGSTIRVSRKYFEMLDLDNRVGLVLHEALSALVKPICESGNCRQPNTPVWDMMNFFFHPSSRPCVMQRACSFATLQLAFFDIDWQAESCVGAPFEDFARRESAQIIREWELPGWRSLRELTLGASANVLCEPGKRASVLLDRGWWKGEFKPYTVLTRGTDPQTGESREIKTDQNSFRLTAVPAQMLLRSGEITPGPNCRSWALQLMEGWFARDFATEGILHRAARIQLPGFGSCYVGGCSFR